MRSRTTIGLVASREIRDRLGNRGFVIGSVVVLLAILGIVIVPTLFADDDPASFDLGVVGSAPADFDRAVAAVAEGREATVDLTTVDSRADADAGVEDGTYDAVLLDAERLLVEGDPDATLRAIVDTALAQAGFLAELESSGVDPEDAAALLSDREPVQVVTPEGDTQEEREAGFGIGFAATVLLFLSIQINAGTLLTGTIEEKSSRVVEVLLGTVRPWQLLAGKLLGMSVLAIGQLAVYVGAILGANAAVGAFDLPEATAGAVVSGLTMFVVGFGFFAALYAVAGSLASSIEDAQSSAGPLGFLVAGIYMAVLLGVVPNPDGILARVLTFLPPSAPFAVPARVGAGAIPGWEIAAGALVTLVGTVVTVRVAGRLYSAALLASGKLSWRQVWRAEPIT